ncbi:MAG: TolC family protein [Robiginitomaculum sp.]|nr:TolC family protein [Robiginitomaculum sp.]
MVLAQTLTTSNGVASPVGTVVHSKQVSLSLAELEAILRLHPALDALSLSAEADRSRAEGALGLPDPIISLGVNNFPLFSPSFTEFLPTHKFIGVQQAIPNAAKRRAGSLKSLRSAAQTELQKQMQFATLRGELYTLLIEREKIAKLRELALAREVKYQELTEIIEIEINAGRPVVFRLAEADVERMEVARTLADLDGKEAAIHARFVDLVGLIPDTPAPLVTPITWSQNALSFYAVRVADAAVEIEDAEVQKAKADFKPDWGVNVRYQQREAGNGAPFSNFDGDDWVSGAVSFTIPFWSKKRQDPNLRAANSDRSAAMARRAAVARQVLFVWKRYQAHRNVAVENIKILDIKIAAIQQQVAATLIIYETGVGDYSSILDGEIAILMLRSQKQIEASQRDRAAVNMNSLLVGAK